MDWISWFTLGAVAVSGVALVVSIKAYRQRERFHPQPKLVPVWGKDLKLMSGLYFRLLELENYGDSAARDIAVDVEFAITDAGAAWHHEAELLPGKSFGFYVPVVDSVRIVRDPSFLVFDREGTPESYRIVTPKVTVSWRQPPFDKGPKSEVFTPPRTPIILGTPEY